MLDLHLHKTVIILVWFLDRIGMPTNSDIGKEYFTWLNSYHTFNLGF
jgi:hypothetical protein